MHAPAKGTPIDVASRDGRKRSHAGVRHHRLRVEARDLRTRTGLPLTSPARTLLDLATVLDAHALEQAVVEADIRRLATPTELRELLHRHRPHKGAARLRAIVERGAWQGLTRSEAERIFRGLMQRASLSPLRINPIKAEHRIDVVFERPRVVVEVDGFKTHGRRKAFEDDHGRDARLELAGWHVLRFSARQLTDVPELVVATVASALARVARAPR